MKLKFNKIIFPVITMILAFNITACSNNNQVTTEITPNPETSNNDTSNGSSDKTTTFSHTNSGISFSYSDNWQIMDLSKEDTALVFLLQEDPEGELLASLNFSTISDYNENISAALQQDMITQLENMGFTNINKSEETTKILDGIEFTSIELTFNTDETSEGKQNILYHSDEENKIFYFIITNLFNFDNFESDEINKVINTYTINKQ